MDDKKKLKLLTTLVRRAAYLAQAHLVFGAFCGEIPWTDAFPEENDGESLATLLYSAELRELIKPHLEYVFQEALRAKKVSIIWE